MDNIKNKHKSKNKILPYIIGCITGIANGFFGAGGGTILVPAMERKLDVEEHKAHATAIAVILPLSIISAIFYTKNIEFEFKDIVLVSIGGVVGGCIGSFVLAKISKDWLHIIFGIFMIVAAIRMVI